MKNAMKRIMGLLLVAVLLVSVVPFQALAAEIEGGVGYKGFDYIEVYFANEVKTTSWVENSGNPKTKTIKNILDNFYSGWSNDYRFRDASYGGQTGITDVNTILHSNFDDTSVVIYLYGIPQFKVNVNYVLEDTGVQRGSAEFTRKDGQTLSYNEIVNAAPEKDAYKVTRVVNGNSQYTSGSITVNRDMWLTAYLTGIGGGSSGSGSDSTTSVLKANYYIDGNYQKTGDFNVDGKTINELITDAKLGNYSLNNYNFASASVGSTSKSLTNVIYRGETVNIYMTTKSTTPSTSVLTANYYIDGSFKKTSEYNVDGKTVSELISLGNYTVSNYTNISASVGGTSKGLNDVIYRGQSVNIYMATKSGTTPDSNVLKADYYVDGSYRKTGEYDVDSKTVRELISLGNYTVDNYSNITASVNGTSKTLSSVIYRGENVKIYLTTKTTNNKFPYDVVLNVYLNNSVGEPDRRININDLAADGVVSMSEVQNLLTDKYYKAKTSKGIVFDGLYLAQGNWVENWSKDYEKYEDKITGVDEMRANSRVDINVMLTNATRKTTSTADTSNPKTGDAIFMTITVMGLSAAALTGLYFYDKKRKAL